MRTLTLEDRRIIEKMWADNSKPVQIAAELGVSQCTVCKRQIARDLSVSAGDKM